MISQKEFVRITYFLLPIPFVGIALGGKSTYDLWLCFAVVSGVLQLVKYVKYSQRKQRPYIVLCDVGFVFLQVILSHIIPGNWGVLKVLILAIAGGLYFVFATFKLYELRQG
ncbi:hypothetical protein EQM14_15570 [Caproiciproducens sp. NJN-50]|uniref:hypothetical protein n=1 Tax=Acutalibacteraceae TaxID=3082771 RepID=UPI000FFE1FD3|nr:MULTISPECIES: hypothetical protein [Acutalibacteraceae]QAT51073.1 hypothetical protein EQM14_15570 [Caproiciproducens sp. NJN-50]